MKRFTMWALFAIVALIISVSTAGCTSNVTNQAANTGNMATYESGNFTIQYPSDWKKATLGSTSYDTFSVSSGGTSVTAMSMNMSVGSFSSYTNSRIETLKSTNFTLIESGNTTLAGNPAYKAVYTFNSGSLSTKTMEIWTIKEGILYSITYVTTPGNYDANVQTAQKMIDSFQIK
jgi:hypothetical protein